MLGWEERVSPEAQRPPLNGYHMGPRSSLEVKVLGEQVGADTWYWRQEAQLFTADVKCTQASESRCLVL